MTVWWDVGTRGPRTAERSATRRAGLRRGVTGAVVTICALAASTACGGVAPGAVTGVAAAGGGAAARAVSAPVPGGPRTVAGSPAAGGRAPAGRTPAGRTPAGGTAGGRSAGMGTPGVPGAPGAPGTRAAVPALAVTVVSPPAPPTPKHPFARYVIIGMVSRVRAAVLVRLPAAYFDPAQRARRFPVVETFHGTPGHAPQWLGKLRLGDVIDREAAAGRMSEAIVVSPEMNYPDQADRECVDGGPGRPALETWATRDVPNWLISTFRIRTDPGSWATIGLSAGGWCAAMSTMLHPDRYRAAIVMSGYFRPEFSGPTPYLTSPGRASRYDLVALAHSAPPPVAVWLLTSPRDGGSYPTCQELADARAPLSVTSVVLPGQDHAWDVWARFLVTALDWLARSAPGFAPSSPPAR